MLTSFGLWLVALLFCAALVWWIAPRIADPVRDLLLPMWLPASVLVVAGYALFFTDQGRDLGVGLLGSSHGKLLLLAFALLYWALGTWHMARIGLDQRWPDRAKWPRKYKFWLPSLPRLLGAFAHLFAALSLAFATRYAIDPAERLIGWTPLWGLAFVPPAIIVAGTLVLLLLHRKFAVSRARLAALEQSGLSCAQAKDAYRRRALRLRLTVWALIPLPLLISALLLLVWKLPRFAGKLPEGVPAATLWILGSATAFMLVVSNRGQIKRQLERIAFLRPFCEAFKIRARSDALATLLSVLALLVAAVAWYDPVFLGNLAGSMVTGFFAFGAAIALIGVVRLLSGQKFAAFCALAILLAALNTATREFHTVRLCGDALTSCEARWTDERPSVAQAARAWHAQAAKEWPASRGPVPMIIVATAGGGIRAAQWTAAVLERLEQDLGPQILRRHLFAISGVSGGSVGAAAYIAELDRRPESAAFATKVLERDFLAPALAALAFVDLPSTILPDFGQGDRGYALERSWEEATGGQLARGFLSFFPNAQELGDRPWRPALLFNATHQRTGRRVITSHLRIERQIFLDSWDAHDLLKADMPASVAAHNSARFSYVSPAGRLISRDLSVGDEGRLGFLLDGGYSENFGAITALQLVREALRVLGTDNVRPIILQISSDSALLERDRARLDFTRALCEPTVDGRGFLEFITSEWAGLRWRQRDSDGRFADGLNELTAPLAGVMASRVAHNTLASQELAHLVCIERRHGDDTVRVAHQNGAPSPGEVQQVASIADVELTRLQMPASTPQVPVAEYPSDYAHLAMCDEDGAPVAPLGWVLSERARRGIRSLLDEHCGNTGELSRIKAAFGR
jgi:hypothetical protein